MTILLEDFAGLGLQVGGVCKVEFFFFKVEYFNWLVFKIFFMKASTDAGKI